MCRPSPRHELDKIRSSRVRPDRIGVSRCLGSDLARIVAPGLALLLAACASNPPAPVVDLSSNAPESGEHENAPPKSATPGGTYHVVHGDTLYAIAFRNGID